LKISHYVCNMNFARRLRLFIFGILVGCLVVWALLMRGREFPAWTPEGRILEALQQHPVKVSQAARCMMQCNNISNNDMLSVINSADVVFSESTVRDIETPEYILQGQGLNGRRFKMRFRSRMEENDLLAVIPFGDAIQTCDCK
jgi:hypothetical protein